jgi:trehalose synthase
MTAEILSNYIPIVGEDLINQLRQIAASLKGKKIVHVNSTREGGGVAEILQKMVPMTQAAGLDTSWEVVEGDMPYFQCTKSLHNALQGNPIPISEAQFQHYEKTNGQNAERLKSILNEADIVVIHDPQPASLITHFPKRKGKWIWRCHIDISRPYKPVWNHLQKYLCGYDAAIFSLIDFAQNLPIPMFLIPPSIDPLSEKNIDLEKKEIDSVFDLFGIPREAPMILQVSRFDRFKDPIGVIAAYRIAKKFHPKIQLVLAGGTATDDPEGDVVLGEVQQAKGDDPDIHILKLAPGNNRTVNALQRASTVVMQKSIKEGFGLTVTEALWKSKPVIGGNVGGIRLQIVDHKTGFLVNTPEGAANRIRYLLEHPEVMQAMGEKGREFVKEKFLITRHLREYLTLFVSLYSPDSDRIELKK